MAGITLKNITKKYKEVTALDDVSLDIRDNEFFIIFGPAGAGKTTILNVIAGIVEPECGQVGFDGRVMNFVEPGDRNVSMVFENYALYPNMTAYDNIASPFRSRTNRRSEEEIRPAVEKVAKMLGITELLNRLPSKVSNGQRQRIALGRALVRNPNVFLLDEPLAHLDAKLRHAMRKELKSLQESLNATTIYVTHDYTEAMSLGDRIGVIRDGVIQQVGTPDQVFYTPKNEFVAKLFGDPEINIFTCGFDGEYVTLPWQDVRFRPQDEVAGCLCGCRAGKVDMGMRGMNLDYSLERTSPEQVACTVYSYEPLGNRAELIARVDEDLLRFVVPVNLELEIDQPIFVGFDFKNAIYFDYESKIYLGRYCGELLGRGEMIGQA